MQYRLIDDQMKALLSVQYQLQLVHQLMDQVPSQPQVSFSDVDGFIEAQADALARVLDHVDPTCEQPPAEEPASATKPPGRRRERLAQTAMRAWRQTPARPFGAFFYGASGAARRFAER